MAYLHRPLTTGTFLAASATLLGASVYEMKTILSKVEDLSEKIDAQQAQNDAEVAGETHAERKKRYGGRMMSGPGGVDFVLHHREKGGNWFYDGSAGTRKDTVGEVERTL